MEEELRQELDALIRQQAENMLDMIDIRRHDTAPFATRVVDGRRVLADFRIWTTEDISNAPSFVLEGIRGVIASDHPVAQQLLPSTFPNLGEYQRAILRELASRQYSEAAVDRDHRIDLSYGALDRSSVENARGYAEVVRREVAQSGEALQGSYESDLTAITSTPIALDSDYNFTRQPFDLNGSFSATATPGLTGNDAVVVPLQPEEAVVYDTTLNIILASLQDARAGRDLPTEASVRISTDVLQNIGVSTTNRTLSVTDMGAFDAGYALGANPEFDARRGGRLPAGVTVGGTLPDIAAAIDGVMERASSSSQPDETLMATMLAGFMAARADSWNNFQGRDTDFRNIGTYTPPPRPIRAEAPSNDNTPVRMAAAGF